MKVVFLFKLGLYSFILFNFLIFRLIKDCFKVENEIIMVSKIYF